VVGEEGGRGLRGCIGPSSTRSTERPPSADVCTYILIENNWKQCYSMKAIVIIHFVRICWILTNIFTSSFGSHIRTPATHIWVDYEIEYCICWFNTALPVPSFRRCYCILFLTKSSFSRKEICTVKYLWYLQTVAEGLERLCGYLPPPMSSECSILVRTVYFSSCCFNRWMKHRLLFPGVHAGARHLGVPHLLFLAGFTLLYNR
jgi:hypothetical protein